MGLRILQVDDERDSLESLKWLLQGTAYTVLSAAEAAHVLQPDGPAASARPVSPSQAECVARELLHRVALLGACIQLPEVMEPERRLWRAQILESHRRLDELYANGLSRDFLGEPMRLFRWPQGGVA